MPALNWALADPRNNNRKSAQVVRRTTLDIVRFIGKALLKARQESLLLTSMTEAIAGTNYLGGIRQIIPLQLPSGWLTETSKYYAGEGCLYVRQHAYHED